MNNYYEYKLNILYRNSKQFLVLPSDIEKILLYEELIVILIKSNELVNNRNIFCYDVNGAFLWQIPNAVELHSRNDFTGVYVQDENLYAYNRNGVEYKIEKNTGNFLGSQLIR